MNRKTFHAEMIALVKALKKTIGSEYRIEGQEADDKTPMMTLTVGADSEGWSYQTGDNSYSGGAYGFADWAVVHLTRRCNSKSAADDICSQLADLSDGDIFAVEASV